MAKENLSPRQKMINLMYLVFIAMLAMQIDQEIIRSYNDTKESLGEATELTEKKNKIFEETLQQKAMNSEDFTKPYADYKLLKDKINKLVVFIESSKTEMRKFAGDTSNRSDDFDFNALNNTDASTHYFFNKANEGAPSDNAKKLKNLMEEVKNTTLQIFPDNQQNKPIIERAKTSFNTEVTKVKKDWLIYKFYNQPLVAALANLEVIESEARNLQSDALANMLKEKIDANIKFNAFEAIVAAPTVILQGDNATAKVVVGTYASSIPGMTISGVDRVADGQGFKVLNTSTVGDYSFKGDITFKDANGRVITLPYSHSYRVIAGPKEVALQSGAVVSADKMNVLYRGVDNPVSVTMLGVDNSQVKLSAPGASVSGGRGKWIIKPGGGNMVNITVSGQLPNGKMTSATFPFRIKSIPKPQGQIRGENVVTMPASSIKNQTVSAAIPDFDFPVSFTVTSFKVKIPGKVAMTISGNSLSSIASQVANLGNGDVVYVFDIQATATGLGGQMLRNISPVVINVQ
ncbi:type IX secretion system motor protein PorM/GldM [Riemerella columbipharyngis]|uniref:Gliding motility-associated protein GldM n=1 Tax=Riemerella columbipharyngis TaxID=1071918 RepID=A0A1G7B5U5_9FLAO|nr:gliding motility protein GldM [Riemerella columbipharyngis]SDE22227.1 gliding motility-associated protein GldM [Riemerella columbipharyngis]